MIVLLEGGDKTGKTTLGEKLTKALRMPLFSGPRIKHHEDYNKEEITQFYKGVNETVLKMCMMNDNFIIDRFFVSDFVYSKCFNRQQNLKPFELSQIRNRILIVTTHCHIKDQIQRLEVEPGNTSEDDLYIQQKLFLMYEEMFSKDLPEHFRFMRLNTTSMKEAECVIRVQEEIKSFNKVKHV